MGGVEIELVVACTNQPSESRASERFNWDGPVCTLHVDIPDIPKAWPAYTTQVPVDNGQLIRRRVFHGPYVVASPSGDFYFFDYWALYQWMIAGYVLLNIPVKILGFVSCKFLGELSCVYKRVIHEPFDLLEQVAGMATDFVSYTNSYYGLTDRIDGISMDCFSVWMADGLKEETDLDGGELKSVVDICFREIMERGTEMEASGARSKVRRDVRRSLREFKPQPSGSDMGSEMIDISAYLRCRMLSARIALPDLVKLFDKDRRRKCVEMFFTPKTLTRVLAQRLDSEKCENALQMTAVSSDGSEITRNSYDSRIQISQVNEKAGHGVAAGAAFGIGAA
eukprot:NODE_335_length_1658_cov_308.223331.p1 GENE.NODE_335_length_1658_cov_308.223331~~NODE_335_length_1658_cov_308.223331.p1  ORF type:complete len:338 (+),score=64.41 NODE_335_length_1658_cov_308.223331:3-1016(+)